MPEPNSAKSEQQLQLPAFPGEHPARHAASQWMEKMHDKIADEKLQTELNGELCHYVYSTSAIGQQR